MFYVLLIILCGCVVCNVARIKWTFDNVKQM